MLIHLCFLKEADPEGVQGIRSNPPFSQDYFFFIGNSKKNQVKLTKQKKNK